MNRNRLTKDDFVLEREEFMSLVRRHVVGTTEESDLSSRNREVVGQIEGFCEAYYDRIDGGRVSLSHRMIEFKLPTVTLNARDGTEYSYDDIVASVFFGRYHDGGGDSHRLSGGSRGENGESVRTHPHAAGDGSMCSGYNPWRKWRGGNWDGVIDEAILYANTYTVRGAYRVFPEDLHTCTYCDGSAKFEHDEEIRRCSSCAGVVCGPCVRFCAICDAPMCPKCKRDGMGYCGEGCIRNSCPICSTNLKDGDDTVEIKSPSSSSAGFSGVLAHARCARSAPKCWGCGEPVFGIDGERRLSTLRGVALYARIEICSDCGQDEGQEITNQEGETIKKCSRCSGFRDIYHLSRHITGREYAGARMCIGGADIVNYPNILRGMEGVSARSSNPFPEKESLSDHGVYSSLLVYDEGEDAHGYTCSSCKRLQEAPEELDDGILYFCCPSCMSFGLDNLWKSAKRNDEIAKFLAEYIDEDLPMRVIGSVRDTPSVKMAEEEGFIILWWRNGRFGRVVDYHEPVESEESQGVLI